MHVAVNSLESYEFKKRLYIFKEIIKKGGPEPEDYDFIKTFTYNLLGLSLKEEHELYLILKPILNLDNMIGFTFKKPHGYAGDYELIDRIYSSWINKNPKYERWDKLYQNADSAFAVRNRKKYFIDQLNMRDNKKILNIGSGPCTDINEFFVKNPTSKNIITCLDMDKNAIEYGQVICDNHSKSINFVNKNVFKYNTDAKFDLIWSAGLFDYFNDKLFARLLRKLYSKLNEGGELIIGNFADTNPSRGLMEILCSWFLHHRSKKHLKEIALKVGIKEEKIIIDSEETGINLFMHIKK